MTDSEKIGIALFLIWLFWPATVPTGNVSVTVGAPTKYGPTPTSSTSSTSGSGGGGSGPGDPSSSDGGGIDCWIDDSCPCQYPEECLFYND